MVFVFSSPHKNTVLHRQLLFVVVYYFHRYVMLCYVMLCYFLCYLCMIVYIYIYSILYIYIYLRVCMRVRVSLFAYI